MKSRVIPKAPELILSYNIGDKAALVSAAAESLGIQHIEIPLDKAGESLGYLAGYSGFSEKGGSLTAEGECLIFSGISSARLNTVLQRIRAVDIPLKAIITSHNQNKSVQWLITELEKERAAIEKAKV